MHRLFLWHRVLLAAALMPQLFAQGSPSIDSIQNAANYAGGGVAPGEIVMIAGSQIGPDALVGYRLDAANLLSSTLAGTRVLFDSVPAPLVYVYSSQVAAIVPYSTSGLSVSAVQVEYQGNRSLPVYVPITAAAPGLFTEDAAGKGQAAAMNQDGTINSASSPASAGSVISLYATGEGQTNPVGIDGEFASAPRPTPQLPVSVQIGGMDAPVQYSGTALFLHINAQIPAGVASGNAVPVTIGVGMQISQANVSVAVKGGSGATPGKWFVAPSGSSLGQGTQQAPWDLPTALAGAGGRIHPGDTVWLRSGTYHAPNSNGFNSTVTGTAGSPIVIRNYLTERATIDGNGSEYALAVNGGYVWFWGLEIMDSNTQRTTNQTGGVHPNAFGVGVYAPGVRFINNVVHDTAQGFSAYDQSNDSVFFGNLSYYNGWTAPDRRHGHGFYMQNVTGTKVIQDNIVGDNADEGFQIYGSANANIVGFRLFGNASYNTSSWPTPNYSYNFQIADGAIRKDIIFDQNYSFFDPTADYGFVNFGQYLPGQDMSVTNSVFVGGYVGPTVSMQAGPIIFTGNRSYVRASAVDQARLELGPGQNTTGWTWDANHYYGKNLFFNGTTDGTTAQGTNLDFNTWQSVTGFDSNSTWSGNPPSGKWIYIRPNQYESKRANIIIYNWDLSDSVSVDLSKVMTNGDPYVIHDAQNFYGPPVASGTYSGSAISIPMKNLIKGTPIGFAAPAHTAPLFGTFVVMSQ